MTSETLLPSDADKRRAQKAMAAEKLLKNVHGEFVKPPMTNLEAAKQPDKNEKPDEDIESRLRKEGL